MLSSQQLVNYLLRICRLLSKSGVALISVCSPRLLLVRHSKSGSPVVFKLVSCRAACYVATTFGWWPANLATKCWGFLAQWALVD